MDLGLGVVLAGVAPASCAGHEGDGDEAAGWSWANLAASGVPSAEEPAECADHAITAQVMPLAVMTRPAAMFSFGHRNADDGETEVTVASTMGPGVKINPVKITFI